MESAPGFTAPGRLVLRVGSVDAVPFDDATFDGILTCQTVYFWSDLAAGLAELHRVLAPDGRCVVAMMPRRLQERFGFAERGYNVLSHTQLVRQLERSGFADVAPSVPPGSGGRWVVVARKPAEAGVVENRAEGGAIRDSRHSGARFADEVQSH